MYGLRSSFLRILLVIGTFMNSSLRILLVDSFHLVAYFMLIYESLSQNSIDEKFGWPQEFPSQDPVSHKYPHGGMKYFYLQEFLSQNSVCEVFLLVY